MGELRPQIFEVTVDAETDAAFRARLDSLARHGVTVATSPPLEAGAVCGLEIHSRNGRFRVAAEAVAKAPPPGAPPAVLLMPTRFGTISSRPAAGGAPPPAVDAGRSGLSEAPTSVRRLEHPGAISGPVAGNPVSAVSLPAGDSVPVAAGDEADFQPFESLGNYQVLRRLGSGGMAEVYLSRSLLGQGVDKLVALKVARTEFGPATAFGSLFLDEARVSATLQHPNLITVFDFGEAAGRPYLAMEFVHGRDLAAILRALRSAGTPAPPAAVLAIGISVCRALEYVHDKRDLDGRPLNLVHRDVGPANVLVTAHAEVKLMDFGVASAEISSGRGAELMVGKRPYMLAEQLLGQSPSPAWDLYPVGVTLYQLLTLRHPWQGNPLDYLVMPALRFHRGPPSALNAAVPPALDAVVLRATRLDPGERFEHARELREALEVAQAEVGPADVGAWVRSLFGPQLEADEGEFERLMVEARRRTARRVPAVLRALAAPFTALRRRVVYSDTWRRLARRPWLLRALAVGLALLVVGGVAAGTWTARDRGARREALARADAELLAGRLVGPGAGDALDQLLRARAEWSGEPRIERRLALVAQKLEALGRLALERDNLEEAAAHLEAALKAEPGRATAAALLTQVEDAARARSRDKVVQSQ